MKIVLEPAPAPYDPVLYRGTPSRTRPVDTLYSIWDAEIALYREQGYLCVCNALSDALVAGARAELVAMALAADPGCESVGFEGLIRDHLVIDAGRDQIGTTGRKQDFALGQTTDQIPVLERLDQMIAGARLQDLGRGLDRSVLEQRHHGAVGGRLRTLE